MAAGQNETQKCLFCFVREVSRSVGLSEEGYVQKVATVRTRLRTGKVNAELRPNAGRKVWGLDASKFHLKLICMAFVSVGQNCISELHLYYTNKCTV